jgi:hypothetical protein
MTSWIERLHQKKSPYGRNQGDKSAESVGTGVLKNLHTVETIVTEVPKEASVTFGTVVSTVSEVFVVEYQRFWVDYDLPDGTYTPKELRKAKMLVQPGPVLRYRLRWPGGNPQPMAYTQQKGS